MIKANSGMVGCVLLSFWYDHYMGEVRKFTPADIEVESNYEGPVSVEAFSILLEEAGISPEDYEATIAAYQQASLEHKTRMVAQLKVKETSPEFGDAEWYKYKTEGRDEDYDEVDNATTQAIRDLLKKMDE